MAIVAGIDEAGFGPLLGPLVVSAAVFEAPDDIADGDWWSVLAPAVTKTPRKRGVGVAIGDSKKLYKPATGLEHLERGVLAALAAAGDPPASLRALLERLAPSIAGEMQGYPWYRDQDVQLPTAADATGLRLRAKGLRAAMDAAGMRLLSARSEVLLVGRYNRLVAAIDNKATTLLDQTARLIDWARRSHVDGGDTSIFVDRQGGRMRYAPLLSRLFPDARGKKILTERPALSAYRLSMTAGAIEVHFARGGETRHLPVALASMMSKYVRELFMGMLNRYWAAQLDGASLRPTAGYYVDAQRFCKDIAVARRRLDTPDELLVRSR